MTTASYTLHTCVIQPLLEYTKSVRIINLWFFNVFGSLPMIINHSKLSHNWELWAIIYNNGKLFWPDVWTFLGSWLWILSATHTQNNCTITTVLWIWDNPSISSSSKYDLTNYGLSTRFLTFNLKWETEKLKKRKRKNQQVSCKGQDKETIIALG